MNGLLETGAVGLVFGAVGLLRLAARDQPLERFEHARPALRLLAVVSLSVALCTAARGPAAGEGALVIIAALAAAASIFVPLAAVRPRWVWNAALAAPVLWLVMVLACRRSGS